MANHISAQHPRSHLLRNSSKNTLRRPKKSRTTKTDDSKILLKIKAGKSMTIISPTKSPVNDGKKRHGRKKSKKKHRKEEKETQRRGIILSIKKGTVNLSDKKKKEKNITERQSVRLNGLTKPEYKLGEQKSGLKLTLKACPDLTQFSSSKDIYKLSDKIENTHSSSHLSVKKAHSLTDIDQLDKSGHDISGFNDTDETKCRNGIVITKDKSGKFLAEQLQSSKVKKKDRDNVFDSFGEVGLWKVMPSPRTDRPGDVLKLKLSPHKPVRLEPTEDTCNYNASKYLDIPINTAKVKSDASGEDSDAMVSSPAFDKESDGGINNVNDSGIEVLSSSSCNRSNGNSVRSVALEDNSPTYFHAEDSLLSLDSPNPYNLNKSEHSICHKCGGIILEANNNTRSPGKCRCNFSNPNSPFQTPVSPLKPSAQLSDSVKSQDSVYSLAHKNLSCLDSADKGVNDAGMPCESLTASERSETEDCDVMVINNENTASNSDKKSRLKLKLRPKETSVSTAKAHKKYSPNPKLDKSNSYGFVPHMNEKELKVMDEDFKSDSADVSTVETNLCENSVAMLYSLNDKCDMKVHNKSKESGVNSCKLKDVVIDDEDWSNNCDNKESELLSPCAQSVKEDGAHVRKKPLFKCKKQQGKLESQPIKILEQVTEKYCDGDRQVANKKPLFKKRTTSLEDKRGTDNCVPLVKKQMSMPNSVNEEKTVKTNTADSNLVNSYHRNETKSLQVNSAEKVSENLNTVASRLSYTAVAEDDSLQKFPDVTVEPPGQVHKPTSTPLDLFQQQFLSFLSNSINSNKHDINEDGDNMSSGEDDWRCMKQFDVKDSSDSETMKKSKKSSQLNGRRSKSDLQSKVKRSKTSDSVNKIKTVDSKISKKTALGVLSVMSDATTEKINEKSEVPEKILGNEIDKSSNKTSNTDSFSWLKIFSKTEESEKDTLLNSESSKDVMTDLSENLAEINKKMVVSEDDDTNSLDVDDVFEVGRLSILEPKNSFQFDIKNTFSSNRSFASHTGAVSSENKPYKRKQTAKRTIGKFKAVKRKVESDDDSSDACTNLSHHRPDSDLDYGLCMDSDDDFVPYKKRHSVSNGCLTRERGHTIDSTDSENESRCASDCEQLESGMPSSRSTRLKKGRKRLCPCCIGSPHKRSSSQSQAHINPFKLPRHHKQFVRNTLRLLELQEKIHTLFLTLFPDCADLIMCSKIGTDDFELLIDEVVTSLEKTPAANPVLENDDLKPDARISQQFSSCSMNNIGMPFTTPDSTSRTCEIDLVNVLSDEKVQKLSNAIVENNGENSTVNVKVEAIEKEATSIENSGKQFVTGTPWQHPTSINQTLMTSSSNSGPSLKFENNTLTDCYDHSNEEINQNVSLASSYSCTRVTQEVEASNSLSNSSDNKDMTFIDNADGVEFLESDEQFSELQYYTPVEPISTVQSEITITLDLNAVRVSLCRSPKHCLQRLHNQIIKLSKCLLPKLKFKDYFYRNMNNLEFLLDLMLDSNANTIPPIESEDDVDFSEPEEISKWPDIIQNKIDILEAPLIQETDTVQVNFFSSESNSKSEERESLFVKCSDLFEQQIKSQREFLKKDVFSVEEDQMESDWKSAEKVLNSIKSINKMAQRSQVRRPRRESRLRKRSADEKRTLFVQEKLQNCQNSTFVCDGPIRTRPEGKGRPGRKKIKRESSKEKFLSELNLGDTQSKTRKVSPEKDQGDEKTLTLSSSNDATLVNCVGSENTDSKISDPGGTENVELKLVGLCKDHMVKIETDPGLKSPDKNIFELMQPS